MFKKIIFLTLLSPSIAFAGAVEDFENQLQAQFDEVAKDVIGSQASKTLIPAEPLGIIGFDLGVSYNNASLKSDLKDKTYSGISALDSFSIHANKGLPLGIDVGVGYSKSTLMSTINGSLSYALLEGGIAAPAIGLKATYTSTLDSELVNFSSYGADLGVSKGFVNFTPFASVGVVKGEVKTKNDAIVGFTDSYSETTIRYGAGVNINIFIGDLLLAYNKVGEVDNLTAKLGFRF